MLAAANNPRKKIIEHWCKDQNGHQKKIFPEPQVYVLNHPTVSKNVLAPMPETEEYSLTSCGSLLRCGSHCPLLN